MQPTPRRSEPKSTTSRPVDAKTPDIASASVPDTLAALRVDADAGLTRAEVDIRRKESGYNEVTATKAHPVLAFLRKFWGTAAWMLELILTLSAVLGKYADLVVVSALLVVNAVLSFDGWPTFGTTVFGDRVNYTPGLRGGVYLNKRFAIGLTAQGVASSQTKVEDDEVRNFGSYGGLLLQYVWRSDQLIHGTVESTVGDGRWCAAGAGGSCSQFLVFEPAANVEINVAKHVRVASGVGYRFAVAGSGEGPSGRDMSGLLIRSSLIFGSF